MIQFTRLSGSRCVRLVSRNKRLCRSHIRYYSAGGGHLSKFISYVGLGSVFLGIGYYIGTRVYEKVDSEVDDFKTSSTIPLSKLSSPKYANDEQFKQGLDKILQVVGIENSNYNEDVIKSHSDTFFATHHPPKPDEQKPHIIIYPQSTQQVSEILKIANHYLIPVVANSGLTSLEGQNWHTRGPNSISLSFAHLNKIIKVNPQDLDCQVQAGVGWQELNEFLQESESTKHLIFGPDPGMGATIAGMVSTSASGTNAYKYGTMKENVINLTVVLADGTIVKTKQRPRKSSAGYDLTRLFIGAEGTLGIITEITVKLHVKPIYEYVSIASFPTIKDAASTAEEIINKSGIQPNAIEILNETMVSFVNQSNSSSSHKKFIEKPTLFFKIGGTNKSSINEQVELIKTISNKNNLIKFETSHDEETNETLWFARRLGLWSTFEYGSKILKDDQDVQIWTTDIAVPISKLSTIIGEINQDLNESGFNKQFSVMGHIGDGNCHFLILYNSPDYKKVSEIVDRMNERAIKYEGTCTGEHGIGVGKRKYLPIELGETSIDMMRSIKLALDPNRILNPDKIFKIDPHDNLDELISHGNIQENQGCC